MPFFSPCIVHPFLPGLWLACLLDLLIGDPRSLPHPVILIAGIAARFEQFFREKIEDEQRAGRWCVGMTLLVVTGSSTLVLFFCRALSPWLLFWVSVTLLSSCFALRGLVVHALQVERALRRRGADGSLDPAREKVGMIVGRATDQLDESGIVRACIESVAENMSDGVIAPLFYACVGGLGALSFGCADLSLAAAVVASLLYKGVNTMDSMFGYKNERYLQFGRAAALLDDLVNLLPARLSGAILVVGAFLGPNNGRQALKILLRDRRRHASPNAGYPEAAMAGALDIQLGGESVYFGERVIKPTLGDGITQLRPIHIRQAVFLMAWSSFLCLCALTGIYFAWNGMLSA